MNYQAAITMNKDWGTISNITLCLDGEGLTISSNDDTVGVVAGCTINVPFRVKAGSEIHFRNVKVAAAVFNGTTEPT